MIQEARTYLTALLKTVMGTETSVFTTEKELRTCMDSHVAAVLIGGETLSQNGKKYSASSGSARCRYDRSVPLLVTMGEYDMATLEGYYNAFLQQLARGVNDSSGFFISLEPASADWIEKSDEILKANVSVIITINAVGGIYKGITTKSFTDYAVEAESEA